MKFILILKKLLFLIVMASSFLFYKISPKIKRDNKVGIERATGQDIDLSLGSSEQEYPILVYPVQEYPVQEYPYESSDESTEESADELSADELSEEYSPISPSSDSECDDLSE